jgi:hypothetical protein
MILRLTQTTAPISPRILRLVPSPISDPCFPLRHAPPEYDMMDDMPMKPGQRKEKIMERVVDKDFFNGKRHSSLERERE